MSEDSQRADIERATEAIVAQHGEEMAAFLRGEIEANAWRPEKYAEAALRAVDHQGAVEALQAILDLPCPLGRDGDPLGEAQKIASDGLTASGRQSQRPPVPYCVRSEDGRVKFFEGVYDALAGAVAVVEAAEALKWNATNGHDERSDVIVERESWDALRRALGGQS